jgi:hypothetical protein
MNDIKRFESVLDKLKEVQDEGSNLTPMSMDDGDFLRNMNRIRKIIHEAFAIAYFEGGMQEFTDDMMDKMHEK